MSESVSTVELVQGKGASAKTYKLLADLAAFQRLERVFNGTPWFQVVMRFEAGLTIDDTGRVLAALCTDREVEAKTFIKGMSDLRGQGDALKAIRDAVKAAMPQAEAADKGEAGDDATADPQ